MPENLPDTNVGNIEYIRKQDALDAFGLSEKTRKYGGDHSGYDTRMLYEIQDTIESTEPADVVSTESQEIGYDQCANAMLKMWMDNVVTDGEYNRIMDRLNKLYFSDGEREE